jgi:hypothetical protein
MTNIIETDFKHPNWFTQKNETTNVYGPYLSKKCALQYFASCGDFINDNDVLRYTGKEKGSYRMNKTEVEYFKSLNVQKSRAKKEAQKYVSELKKQISETNKRAIKHVIFENTLITLIVYFNSEYVSTNVSFLDYIREQGGDSKQLLADLEGIQDNKNLQTTLF